MAHDARGSASDSVTLTMVARRAGVSRQTVSNALNSPSLLRQDTLTRVNQAIDELGYRRHQAARSLRTRASRLIGYCVQPTKPSDSTSVLDGFLHALSQTADEVGYRILLFPAPAGDSELIAYENLLREHSVDAFVLSHTTHGDRRPTWLHQRSIPFVAFGRPWSSRDLGDWVDVDGAAGTSAAVQRLTLLGHRRIGLLGWPKGSGVGDDRAGGWRTTMATHGLPANGLRADCVDDAEAARMAAGCLVDAGATAIIAVSDVLAIGCYRALRERDLVPGQDISVVGFDDSPVAALVSPSLASVRQPLETVGRECVRLLIDRISDPHSTPGRILLPPELVVRESIGPVPGLG